MKDSLAAYRYSLAKLFRSHQGFIVVTAVLILLVGVFIRINTLGNMPVDQSYLQKQTGEIKNVKFNKEAIEKIKALNDSNVTAPGTELPSNRQNPFSE